MLELNTPTWQRLINLKGMKVQCGFPKVVRPVYISSMHYIIAVSSTRAAAETVAVVVFS